MASKELIEKVAQAIADADMEDYEPHSHFYNALAKAAISTILAALQEPTEGMLDACGENWYYGGVLWKPMLAASALGEQSE